MLIAAPSTSGLVNPTRNNKKNEFSREKKADGIIIPT